MFYWTTVSLDHETHSEYQSTESMGGSNVPRSAGLWSFLLCGSSHPQPICKTTCGPTWHGPMIWWAREQYHHNPYTSIGGGPATWNRPQRQILWIAHVCNTLSLGFLDKNHLASLPKNWHLNSIDNPSLASKAKTWSGTNIPILTTWTPSRGTLHSEPVLHVITSNMAIQHLQWFRTIPLWFCMEGGWPMLNQTHLASHNKTQCRGVEVMATGFAENITSGLLALHWVSLGQLVRRGDTAGMVLWAQQLPTVANQLGHMGIF